MNGGRWLVFGRAEGLTGDDVDDDDDLQDVKARTLAAIGQPRYVEAKGRKLTVITTNTPPAPVKRAAPAVVDPKPETKREKWRRLKAEAESRGEVTDDKTKT